MYQTTPESPQTIRLKDRTLQCRLMVFIVLLGSISLNPACRSASPDSHPAVSPSPTASLRSAANYSEIRQAAFADAFYPADPAEADAMLNRFFEPVQPIDGLPIALIIPHAGWVYSGHVAAFAYKQIEGGAYDTAVIVGPNHTDPTFDTISVYAKGAFETPSGPMPIDEALSEALVSSHERIVFDRAVHAQEHSLEVQLLFLQRVCPDCAIVPILIGQPTPENLDALTGALIDVLEDKQALLIASSDLSHYPSDDDAVTVDSRSLAAIETMDADKFSAVLSAQMAQDIPGLVTCACGEGPIVVAMKVAQALGADHAQVLRYANSADVGGDSTRVVGYGAVMFWRWQPPDFSPAQKSELLSLARRSLEHYLTTAQTLPLDPPADPMLNRRLGAFVTLKLDGELRGCIGRLRGDAPLYQIVAQAAIDAAVNDPRFPPLAADQLDDVEIEISVLSPFKRVNNVNDETEIQVGRHGLLVLYGQQRGVLLPQVPVEQNWDRAEFLEQICLKAGSPDDCWTRATLYTFTAQVFGEHPEP